MPWIILLYLLFLAISVLLLTIFLMIYTNLLLFVINEYLYEVYILLEFGARELPLVGLIGQSGVAIWYQSSLIGLIGLDWS